MSVLKKMIFIPKQIKKLYQSIERVSDIKIRKYIVIENTTR